MKSSLLQNLSRQRYLEYLKLLPDLRKQKVRDYTMLIFTFFAITFFGIFAINPTLSTITKLLRELEDSKFAEKSLQEKVTNLSSLISAKSMLNPDLPVIFMAIPVSPRAPELLAQLQALALTSGVTIIDLQAYEVELAPSKNPTDTNSFEFSINVTGDNNTIGQFVSIITTFNRLVTITGMSYSTTESKSLSIKGKAFYIPEQ